MSTTDQQKHQRESVFSYNPFSEAEDDDADDRSKLLPPRFSEGLDPDFEGERETSSTFTERMMNVIQLATPVVCGFMVLML